MLAIPSPDVLMSLSASIAQVLGLVFLCLGGGYAAKKRQSTGVARNGAPQSRRPFAVASLLLLGVSAAFLFYHFDVQDREQRRLRTNLVRTSKEGGQQVGDTSLKTLGYSEQTQHPSGVTTQQLDEWMKAGRGLNLIDVRETEENEMGRLAGTWHRRYPDLQASRDGLVREGVETILLCESGNRSSELADYFAKEGIRTHFMIGGHEKWVAEGRSMVDRRDDSSGDIRAVPDFPNKAVLLDTEAATRLFLEENVLFVDVRYPEDFARGHLPGAVNIPLRKLRSDEVAAALAALPKRPIVAPCYDKRSSFFGLILGAKLSRLGHDFRGRYTVPHEWFIPKKDSEWMASWNAANAERTLFGDTRDAIGGWLQRGSAWLGSLALAVVALALVLRLLLVPLSAKADRDGLLQKRHAAELRGIKESLRDDPTRQRRAVFAWFREHRITPLRNVAASMLQLVLFMFCFAAVDAVAATSTEVLGWLPMAAPDPWYIAPAVATVLLAALVAVQMKAPKARSLVAAAAFVVAIAALMVACRGAVQLYLAVSFGVLLLQSLLVRRALREPKARAVVAGGLVPLRDAAGRPELGGKASRLGELLAAGMPVPNGFVVPARYVATPRELARACHALRSKSFAVRSSACGEDGADKSFAGEFRTLLDVPFEKLPQAIASVRESYDGRSGGVVVQELVPAEHAGVLFTEDPAHAGRMLVEFVDGLGEALVSGAETPTEQRFWRTSMELVDDCGPAPFDLGELLRFGRALERRFGAPQDIEWAYAGGRFLLLQSRNITARAGHGDDPVAVREHERARLLALAGAAGADDVVFAADDYAALLPEPTPYSLALMQSIWAPGGSVDLACRRLGLGYTVGERHSPHVVSAFGRCYVDQRSQPVRTSSSAAFRLGARAPAIEESFVDGFLPEFERAARWRAKVDLAQMSTADLQEFCRETRERFVRETYVEAEVLNLAAHAHVSSAQRRLAAARLDAGAELGRGMSTIVQRSFALLDGTESVQQRATQFLKAFGHRAPCDFELAMPRFTEDRARVVAMANAAAGNGSDKAEDAEPVGAVRGRLLRTDLQRARRFQELKELGKHAAARDLALLRAVLLEIGRRHELGELVFYLEPAEVDRLCDAAFQAVARDLAASRQRRLAALRAVEVPVELTPGILERVGQQEPLPMVAAGELRGSRVAGNGDLVGRARVLRSASELDGLAAGEVLVVRSTDPCWLPAFRRAGGLVSEVGGWLSHAAIQAREHGLPAIVGVRGATARILDGELVKLRSDGVVERLERGGAEERDVAEPRTAAAARPAMANALIARRREAARRRASGQRGLGSRA
jgi:rhodanese-related sulfurtransferase/phosphohistidine swiveling domain-containing protein/membrane protein insertase Oxa1/YidC/SpoIIIJ